VTLSATPQTRRQRRSDFRQRWLGALGTVLLVAGCTSPTSEGSPGASGIPGTSPSAAAPTAVAGSAGASIAPSVAPPTSAPTAVPAPTGTISEGFEYGDILKVQVNNLAVRAQPKRTAALVHAYELGGPAPVDHGLVRLDRGDFVSVHLGPVQVGSTVWYLVYPSLDGDFHTSPIDWYTEHPSDGSPGPGWMAASVGADVYATLVREPGNSELEGFEPVGLNAAGTGPFVSAPQPRHDGWSFSWAAATPEASDPCTVHVELVPGDATVEPVTAIETSTSAVKVSVLGGKFLTAPWLPAPAGSWDTFTVQVSGTCRWAIRLTPLHHD
jgi:hypothetical protein